MNSLKLSWERLPKKIISRDLKEQNRLIRDMQHDRERRLVLGGAIGKTLKPYKRRVDAPKNWKEVKDVAFVRGTLNDALDESDTVKALSLSI